ncbi:MAG: hypothetical protein EON59_11135 [Alphaproteobacteria bacterium]|nr:MAG: hypothetical protein EON59_11135 [Alphaproteobacteria bacterium]
MHVLLRVLGVLALSTYANAASAEPPDSFAVSTNLTYAGRSFARPSIVVLADKPATIEVPGAGGYKLTLTVSELDTHEIKVVAKLDSSHGSMAPTVVVRPGRPASASVGDLGLALTVSGNDG